MKIILHDVTNDELPILALRAAHSVMKNGLPKGKMQTVFFENGEAFQVHQNAKSISVWKFK